LKKARFLFNVTVPIWSHGRVARRRRRDRETTCSGRRLSCAYIQHRRLQANKVVRDIESTGGRALAIRASGTDAEAVRNAVTHTVHTFGRLDVLVNNAGYAILGPPDSFSLDDFDRMFSVNVRSAIETIQEACRYMGQCGRIINIGSGAAERMPWPEVGAYTMTKAAVAGLTRGLARDLGPRGITINNVQPGPTNTERLCSTPAFSHAQRYAFAHRILHRFSPSS